MTEIPEAVARAARVVAAFVRHCPDIQAAEATVAAAILQERERCAMIADQWEAKSDEKFAGCIAAHDRGQKNLELAAAACAGMSHQARHIAAAIRRGE